MRRGADKPQKRPAGLLGGFANMKAHIAALPPVTALAWKVPEDSALDKVCAGAGVRLRTVKEEDLGRTVAALCGLPGAEEGGLNAGPADPTPALVLWGLDRKGLDAFLDRLRQAQVSIPLKAVVTDTNRSWTFDSLLKELAAERREVEQRQK